jgi:tripartite-type tricarboxylate transporter receptor subunit TctC
MKRVLASLAALAVAAFCASPVQAQEDGSFFKGKTIRILVGFPPGGAYDFYARLGADMLKAHIPGLESAIVENKPGAGGLVATNFLYEQGSKDGLTLGVLPDTIANTQLIDPSNSKWDVRQFRYIGSFSSVNSAVLRRANSLAKSLEEMKQREIIVGCSGRNAQSYQFPAMLAALGGYKFKMICGYTGAQGYSIALERGEIDMVSSAWATWRVTHRGQMDRGEMVPVFQIGLRRTAELPDTPLMQELVADAVAKQAIEFVSAGTAIGRALTAPPGVPEARIEYLRKAFDRMTSDPEMKAMAEKRNLILDPTSGKETQAISDAIVSTPKNIIDLAATAFK